MTDKVKIKTFPPSGTRDFFPEDMILRNWIFDQWKDVSREFGCNEYDAPIVEHSELWTEKNGGDDILKEMYAFEKDGIQLALRPEMTPSLARMMMNYLPTAVLPVKLFSIPQCWRYDNVSRGRRREFYQWNVDSFGAENIKSEIEMFLLVITFFKRIGLTSDDVVIRISNRMIIQKVFKNIGVPDDKFELAYNVLDKIEKLSRTDITNMFKELVGISESNVNDIYDLANVKTFDDLVEYLGLEDETYLEMAKLFEYAHKVGISDWICLDLSIVRGLSYYTGFVFECFPKNSELKRAIFGGGRYDNLMKSYGYSEHIKCLGFGMGDAVLYEVLKDLGKLPQVNIKTDYVIIPFNETYFCDACNIAGRLREKGKIVDVYIKENKIKLAYSYADRKHSDKVIFVAPNEWANKQIVIKDLRTTDPALKQVTIDLEQYLATLN